VFTCFCVLKLFHSYIDCSIANRKSSQFIILLILFHFMSHKLNMYVLCGKKKGVRKSRHDTNQQLNSRTSKYFLCYV